MMFLLAKVDDPYGADFFGCCACPLFALWCPIAYFVMRMISFRAGKLKRRKFAVLWRGCIFSMFFGSISSGIYIAAVQALVSRNTEQYQFRPIDNVRQWLSFAMAGGIFGFIVGLGLTLKAIDKFKSSRDEKSVPDD